MSTDRRTCATDLQLDPTAPRAARRVAQLVLQQWGVADDEAVSTVLLIVSELVTNALDHARAGTDVTTLELVLDAGVLRVAVVDRSSVVPRMRAAGEHDTDGRGLRIVDLLTVRWGVEPQPAGKRVYAEVPLDGRLPGRALDEDGDSLTA